MCLYVTVVMYLHVSAMSVESRCFPQFLLRSLGGILGDSWGMRQSEAPNAKLTLRWTFGGSAMFQQSDRLWQIFAALHGTFNKLLMLLVHVISAISGPNDTAKAWDVIATQALASGRCFQPQDMRVSESSAHPSAIEASKELILIHSNSFYTSRVKPQKHQKPRSKHSAFTAFLFTAFCPGMVGL